MLDVDRRMKAAGFPYCVIKTYGANPEYNDSNIDVVTDVPMRRVVAEAFADHDVTFKDEIKTRFYETNKLMAKLDPPVRSDIHLHTNAGWHGIEFVSCEEIFSKAITHPLEGGSVQILERELDAKLFILQVIFENHKKRKWDNAFLTHEDWGKFADEFGFSEAEIGPIRDAKLYLDLDQLRPVWRGYYQQRKVETSITPWNHFLHWLLWTINERRRKKEERS
jgi:hypothetical protein